MKENGKNTNYNNKKDKENDNITNNDLTMSFIIDNNNNKFNNNDNINRNNIINIFHIDESDLMRQTIFLDPNVINHDSSDLQNNKNMKKKFNRSFIMKKEY